jgi:ACR3 family arsenite efflux pump ArsB
MLNLAFFRKITSGASTSFVLISAIFCGSLVGHFSPSSAENLSNGTDYTLLLLVGLLFFGVRFSALTQLVKSLRFFAIAITANFIIVPFIGYGIAALFLSDHPFLFVGLVIYFMSPCTDWFLSFTRLAKGNVSLGTVLIPINMSLQLLLYPVFLSLFTENTVNIESAVIANTLSQWFLIPLIVALVFHAILRKALSASWFDTVLNWADRATLWLTALLLVQIFAGNIAVSLSHLSVLLWVLIAVFTFFVLTFCVGEAISHVFRLRHPEHALLTMTIAARNAPLMLAVTVTVLPDQPLVYTALVIGMLVEMPHLTVLRHILLSRHAREAKHAAMTTEMVNI